VQKARADGLSRALVFPGGSAKPPFAGVAALLHLVPGPRVLERGDVAVFATVGGPSATHAGGSRAAQWVLLRSALDEAGFR
jgi:hypothetical protein